MRRPQLELADIIRSAGADFIERNRSWLRWTHLKVLLTIAPWFAAPGQRRTLLEIAPNPAPLGAEIGFFSVLRTWNPRNSNFTSMSTVSFPPADSPAITPPGFDPTRTSSFPLLYCGACFVARASAALKSAFEPRHLRLAGELDSSLHRCGGSSSTGLDDSRQLLHPRSLAPFNLHKSRARRASGFLLTAFSNATPHSLFQP